MDKALTIDVLISTIGTDGLSRVKKIIPPFAANVRYIVSWQINSDIPAPEEYIELSNRSDVEIHRLHCKGLSKNRNNCLRHSHADIMLIADDDIEYDVDAFDKIRKCFLENPDCDIALFRYDGADAKIYPDKIFRVGRKFPKRYYVSSIEIAIRNSTKTKNLLFNENFGLGAPIFHCGEEKLFIHDALKRKSTIMMFPVTICTHRDLSTGPRMINSPGVLRANGACIAITTPVTAIPRIIVTTIYLRKQGVGILRSLRYLFDGAARVWMKLI